MTERVDNVIAWTEREGPGTPPASPRPGLTIALAGILGTIFSAILFTDTLCPEHRAWVQSLALVALVGTVVSIAGLLRSRASAPFWALGSALCGVAIGILDAAHAPGRGRLVALAFAVVAVGAVVLVTHQVRLQRWQQRVTRDLNGPVDDSALSANDRRPSNVLSDAPDVATPPTRTR